MKSDPPPPPPPPYIHPLSPTHTLSLAPHPPPKAPPIVFVDLAPIPICDDPLCTESAKRGTKRVQAAVGQQQSSTTSGARICAACGVTGTNEELKAKGIVLKACNRCKETYYCSVEHQRADCES
jgi:hypothetical protein